MFVITITTGGICPNIINGTAINLKLNSTTCP